MRYHHYRIQLTDHTLEILGDDHLITSVDIRRCTSSHALYEELVRLSAIKVIPPSAQAAFSKAIESLMVEIPGEHEYVEKTYRPAVERWNEQAAKRYSDEASYYEPIKLTSVVNSGRHRVHPHTAGC